MAISFRDEWSGNVLHPDLELIENRSCEDAFSTSPSPDFGYRQPDLNSQIYQGLFFKIIALSTFNSALLYQI